MRVFSGKEQTDVAEEIPFDEENYVKIADTTLRMVTSMSVLGCIVSADAGMGDEVDDKISKSVTAFYSNKTQLMCRNVSINLRIRLLYKLVGQVLLFGCETMALTQSVLDRYDSAYNRFV
eukprot:8107171-Karenia_brevis.AAC.1